MILVISTSLFLLLLQVLDSTAFTLFHKSYQKYKKKTTNFVKDELQQQNIYKKYTFAKSTFPSGAGPFTWIKIYTNSCIIGLNMSKRLLSNAAKFQKLLKIDTWQLVC